MNHTPSITPVRKYPFQVVMDRTEDDLFCSKGDQLRLGTAYQMFDMEVLIGGDRDYWVRIPHIDSEGPFLELEDGSCRAARPDEIRILSIDRKMST